MTLLRARENSNHFVVDFYLNFHAKTNIDFFFNLNFHGKNGINSEDLWRENQSFCPPRFVFEFSHQIYHQLNS